MMQLRTFEDGRQIWAHTLGPHASGWQDPPFDGAPFVCLVVNDILDLPHVIQNELANRIVAARCRFAVCAGFASPAMEDAIDWAHIAACTDDDNGDDDDDDDDSLIMTTSHRDESKGEIAFFLLHCTNFGDHIFKHYLILFVGTDIDTENAFLSACNQERR
jgi:hypothetical protein